MRRVWAGVLLVAALQVAGIGFAGLIASEAVAAVCSDYTTQEEAQRAADTKDPDGDGVYCEGLPSGQPSPEATSPTLQARCYKAPRVVPLTFNARRYRHIAAHARRAIRRGYPAVMTLRRAGAAQRRRVAVRRLPTRPGHDRDEYPAAVGRRVNRASVAYVPRTQNRSHGARLGNLLRPYCDGTRFRYVFR